MNHDLVMAVRTIMAAVGGAFLSIAIPVLPYAAVCSLMVAADTFTAWRLGRRVARRTGRAAAGKFQSCRMGAALGTLGRIYGLLLMAAAVRRVILLPDVTIDIVRACAAAVCLWQALSMLENEASCSGALWARIARRWLIDKTERHTGISLDELHRD